MKVIVMSKKPELDAVPLQVAPDQPSVTYPELPLWKLSVTAPVAASTVQEPLAPAVVHVPWAPAPVITSCGRGAWSPDTFQLIVTICWMKVAVHALSLVG